MERTREGRRGSGGARARAAAGGGAVPSVVVAAGAVALVLAGAPPAAGQPGETGRGPADVPHRVSRVTGPSIPGAGEVSVALDPSDPRRMLAASLSSGAAGGPGAMDFTYRSRDGGRSWRPTPVPNPGDRVQGDDAVAFSADGPAHHVYISFVGIRVERPRRAVNGIFVRTTRDGGRTWEAPVPVVDHLNTVQPFEDKPWIAVDDVAGSPHRGHVYVAWTRFDVYGSESPNDSTQIWFARSVDGGASFEPGLRISDRGGDAVDSDDTVEGAVPAVGPGGRVYVAWAGPRGIIFDRSTDGGHTFGTDVVIADNPGGWDIDAAGFVRHNGMPVTAVDRSGGPDDGSVYVTWIDTRAGDPDVFLTASRNRGRSWASPVRVNGDPEGNGADQLFHWTAVDPADGSVNVAYLDRRASDSTEAGVVLARSVDGGRSFVEYRVERPPFTPDPEAFYGDYIGVSAASGRVAVLYPVFTVEGKQVIEAAVFRFREGTQEALEP